MNVALVGHGRMGRMLEGLIAKRGDMRVSAIVDVDALPSLADAQEVDVAVDFSYPGNLARLLADAQGRRIPLVIGTTGYTSAQTDAIAQAAGVIPIVFAANYSLGVNVLLRVVRQIAPYLTDAFDVEITETHHRQKADAPSGTAKALLRAVDPAGKMPVVYGRQGMTGARGREIGMHALRGGTVAGEHRVQFFGEQEELEIRHRADSREVFAAGALCAAAFVVGQPAGLYSMEDVLFGGK